MTEKPIWATKPTFQCVKSGQERDECIFHKGNGVCAKPDSVHDECGKPRFYSATFYEIEGESKMYRTAVFDGRLIRVFADGTWVWYEED